MAAPALRWCPCTRHGSSRFFTADDARTLINVRGVDKENIVLSPAARRRTDHLLVNDYDDLPDFSAKACDDCSPRTLCVRNNHGRWDADAPSLEYIDVMSSHCEFRGAFPACTSIHMREYRAFPLAAMLQPFAALRRVELERGEVQWAELGALSHVEAIRLHIVTISFVPGDLARPSACGQPAHLKPVDWRRAKHVSLSLCELGAAAGAAWRQPVEDPPSACVRDGDEHLLVPYAPGASERLLFAHFQFRDLASLRWQNHYSGGPLDFLKACAALEELDVWQIEPLDVRFSPAEVALPRLRVLRLSGMPVPSLNRFGCCAALAELDLTRVKIEHGLLPAQIMPRLRVARFEKMGARWADLQEHAELEELAMVNVVDFAGSSVLPPLVKTLKKLERLTYEAENDHQTMRELESASLRELRLVGCEPEPGALAMLPRLERLTLRGKQVFALFLESNTRLTHLALLPGALVVGGLFLPASLESLVLSEWHPDTLDDILPCTNLTSLTLNATTCRDCKNTAPEGRDYSAVAALDRLETLVVRAHEACEPLYRILKDVRAAHMDLALPGADPARHLTGLQAQHLVLHECPPLTSLDFLNAEALESLDITCRHPTTRETQDGVPACDISALAACKRLQRLRLTRVGASTLHALEKHPTLVEVGLFYDDKICDVSALETCPRLDVAHFSYCRYEWRMNLQAAFDSRWKNT